MKTNSNAETLVSRLTVERPAAIATIAVRGPMAVEVVARHTRIPTHSLSIGRVVYATWPVYSSSEQIREQVVLCRTSAETMEVHCHGGNAICAAILNDLRRDCRQVPADEWPSGLSCPIARAAESDLVHATTDRAAAILLDQLSGALADALRSIAEHIQLAHIDRAISELKRLERWGSLGVHLIEPWRVTFAGPPNVGKSSLVNALAGQNRSIVHCDPGTTRDWVESPIVLGGWPISLTDTAGIRATANAIEAQGVQRATQRLLASDLVVLVVDATIGWTELHTEIAELVKQPMLVAWNKMDLIDREVPPAPPAPPARFTTKESTVAHTPEIIRTSATGESGTALLLHQLEATLVPEAPEAGTPVPSRRSQLDAIAQTRRALESDLVAEALASLAALYET